MIGSVQQHPERRDMAYVHVIHKAWNEHGVESNLLQYLVQCRDNQEDLVWNVCHTTYYGK